MSNTKTVDTNPPPAPYQRLVAPLEAIPKALRDRPVWCAWRLLPNPGKKPGKKPVSPLTGGEFDWNKPGFCTTADKAIAYANSRPDLHGIGLVVGDGISGGDLDHCIIDGQPSVPVQPILNEALTYTEVSPGLNGYRFLFVGSFGGNTGNNKSMGVEFYEDNRFLTFTGLHLPGTSKEVELRNLTALGARWFNKDKPEDDDDDKLQEAPKEHIHFDLDDLKISAETRATIEDGVAEGERSEAVFAVACALIRAGLDDATVCHILTDPAYKISEKAFAERKRQSSAMRWTMRYAVTPARKKVAAEQSDVLGLYANVEMPPPDVPPADAKWPWEAPVDILDETVMVTPYQDGTLPAVYEEMMNANWRYHTHATREPYAGLFFAAVACHTRPSVRVEEKPGGEKMFSLNEQAGVVDGSTNGKTSTMVHAIGFDGDNSPLKHWSDTEKAVALKKFTAREEQIRSAHPNDEKLIAELIKQMKAEMPIPDIINVKINDKAIVETNAANDQADVPTNIVVDEWEQVYGAAAYRNDGGNSISDLHRKMNDNEAYSDKKSGPGGKIASDRMGGNLVFNCTPADMSKWPGYDRAMSNGDMARKSLYAAGKRWEGEKDRVIKREAIAAWHAVLVKLHGLSNLRLRHEEDFEFDDKTDIQIKNWGRMADDGQRAALWLAKAKIRCSRWAAELYLVDQLVAGVTPVGEVTIPKTYRRRAWRTITQFAWPHQVYVHGRLVANESFSDAMQILLRRVYATGKTVVKADDITGGKSSQAMRRGGEEMIKALLFSYKWLRPKATRVSYNHQRPWEAHQFEVNPGLFEVYHKYDEYLREAHEVAKGNIRDNFGDV